MEGECPRFLVDVLGETLLLSLPAQTLPEHRGYIHPHLVQARLRPPSLELELYALSRQAGSRRLKQRPQLLSVGTWTVGAYVQWRDERTLDFLVLDAVDSCLRRQLPPGGGIPTFKQVGLLASAAGVSFRA